MMRAAILKAVLGLLATMVTVTVVAMSAMSAKLQSPHYYYYSNSTRQQLTIIIVNINNIVNSSMNGLHGDRKDCIDLQGQPAHTHTQVSGGKNNFGQHLHIQLLIVLVVNAWL